MTTREKALLASSPGITLLVAGLVWWAIDRHAIDVVVRWLDEHARL